MKMLKDLGISATVLLFVMFVLTRLGSNPESIKTGFPIKDLPVPAQSPPTSPTQKKPSAEWLYFWSKPYYG